MVNLLKYRYKSCRKYEDDIWGFVVQKGKFNKLGEFLCSLDSQNKSKNKRISRSSGFKLLLNDRKKVCLFYGGLKVYELTRYCRYAKYEGTGSFSDDVVSLLERRLAVVVYRLNFVSSVAEGIAYVKAGYFLVNKEIITSPNYSVKVGDLVEVHPHYKKQLNEALVERLEKYFYPMAYPKYVEVNYELMSGMLISDPKMSEVYYPFNLDENFFYVSYHSRIR